MRRSQLETAPAAARILGLEQVEQHIPRRSANILVEIGERSRRARMTDRTVSRETFVTSPVTGGSFVCTEGPAGRQARPGRGDPSDPVAQLPQPRRVLGRRRYPHAGWAGRRRQCYRQRPRRDPPRRHRPASRRRHPVSLAANASSSSARRRDNPLDTAHSGVAITRSRSRSSCAAVALQFDPQCRRGSLQAIRSGACFKLDGAGNAQTAGGDGSARSVERGAAVAGDEDRGGQIRWPDCPVHSDTLSSKSLRWSDGDEQLGL